MRTLADLKFIASRVIEHCRANPPTEPLLGTPERRPHPEVCWQGHDAWRERRGRWECVECERLRHARNYATRKATS